MIEKIRSFTGCVNPGGEGHGFTWKDIKNCTLNNAE